MAVRPLYLRRRLFCTTSKQRPVWPVKQVTKSNFTHSTAELKNHISNSDFIAVALQNTGSFSAPWQRVSLVDTPETAYLKSKYAAERFQVFQFAVCPFTFRDSKIIAHPYNFHLFPRNEVKVGMPSYTFSCQTSYLTSMAQEGFDLNVCISDGISYLSRDQELAAYKTKNLRPCDTVVKSSSTYSVADAVFMERIKSRVKYWRKGCLEKIQKVEDDFLKTMRDLIQKSSKFGSRQCINIDVCSEHQVQLVLETLSDLPDDLVPLVMPAKSGGTQAVCIVLTTSKEDKDLFARELKNVEEEDTKKVGGFRAVIDMISISQKPVISYSSLNDFTFVHSKFLAPLPPNTEEFMSSLRLVFPLVLDVNHLMKEVGILRKQANLAGSISYFKNSFFSPINVEISHQATEYEDKNLGHNVVSVCHVFAKLYSILKIAPDSNQSEKHLASSLEDYANIFSPCSTNPQEAVYGDIRVSENNPRKVRCEDLVFLWGFRGTMSARVLKSLLLESSDIFSSEFDVQLVDKSCAIVVFLTPGLSQTFLDVMNSDEISGPLREMVSEGVRVAGYETYKKVCRLGIWEAELADSLDKALEDPPVLSEDNSQCSDFILYS